MRLERAHDLSIATLRPMPCWPRCWSRSTTPTLIEMAVVGDIELITSPVLLAELRDVLGREHLASRLKQQHSTVEQAIALYAEPAISVSPLTTPRAVPDDVR